MDKLLFRTLLAALGLLLSVAGRCSTRFRNQVTRNLVIEVAAADGVGHHYLFSGANRTVRSRAGRAPAPTDLSLTFENSRLGFLTLIRTDGIGRIVRLILDRRATYTGNATYALWFWGLSRMVLPLGRQRPLREGLPGALTAPDPASKVAGRITREPVAEQIDPALTDIIAAHRKMAMVRGSAGAGIPMW
jgi:hypothetical protein